MESRRPAARGVWWMVCAVLAASALGASALGGCSLDRAAGGEHHAGVPDDALSFDAQRDTFAPDASSDAQQAEDDAADGGRDGGLPSWHLDYSAATFTRATEASYLTEAPSDGAGFLSWAAPGVLRMEDRGDGAGPLVLLEGARINLIVESRILSASAWALPGSPTMMRTDDTSPGPDGAMLADHFTGAAGYSVGQTVGPQAGVHAVSAWGRAAATTTSWTTNFSYPDQPSTAAWSIPSVSTTWMRPTDTVPTITQGAYYPQDLTITGGALDLIVDLHQVEVGAFASSVIRTGNAATARDADVLVFDGLAIPAAFFTDAAGISQLSPAFASDAVGATDEMWLVSLDHGGIRMRRTAVGIVLEVVESSNVRATSQPLSFSAHQLLGPVRWSPREGVISVAGTVGPPGTPWTWSVGRVRIGGILDGAGEIFARAGVLDSD